jgi:hypothetical protein
MKISNQELIYVLEEANKKHLNRNYLVNPYFRISKLTPETFTKYKYIENKSIDLFKVILVVILLSISLSKLFLQFLISLIFYYQHIIFRKDIKKYDVLFISHALGENVSRRRDDQFFALMPNKLSQKNSKVAVIYTNHELLRYKANLKRLKSKDLNIGSYLLPKFLTPLENLDFFKTILPKSYHCLRLSIKYREQDPLKSQFLFFGFRNFFERETYSNYAIAQRVKTFSRISKISYLFFTFEGQSYEQFVMDSLIENNLNIKFIFYQHSPLTKAHIGVKDFIKSQKELYTILVTGHYYKKFLGSLTKSKDIIVVGSNKHSKHMTLKNPEACRIVPNRILFAPEGTRTDTSNFIKLIKFLASNNPNFKYVLRLHPNLRLTNRIRWDLYHLNKKECFSISLNSLEDDLCSSQILFYRSSAVGIQSLKHEILPIFYTSVNYENLNVIPDNLSFVRKSYSPSEALVLLTTLNGVKRNRVLDHFFSVLNYNELDRITN